MFTSSPKLRVIAHVSTGATCLGFGTFAVIAAVDPDHFDHLARKDNFADTGLIEHLTVAVLIPGIAAAGIALARWRRVLESGALTLWLLLWTLACIYFAGEECSWGQWYMGFETPEALTSLNDQGEMNLHNISSWLDQKPRTLVEMFVITAGFLFPAVWMLRNRRVGIPKKSVVSKSDSRDWLLIWTLAPAMCWAAGAVFLFQRIADEVNTPWMQRVGTSEFRELVVAWFLSLYLISYALRMHTLASKTDLS